MHATHIRIRKSITQGGEGRINKGVPRNGDAGWKGERRKEGEELKEVETGPLVSKGRGTKRKERTSEGTKERGSEPSGCKRSGFRLHNDRLIGRGGGGHVNVRAEVPEDGGAEVTQ
jgi:hypothetical protein